MFRQPRRNDELEADWRQNGRRRRRQQRGYSMCRRYVTYFLALLYMSSPLNVRTIVAVNKCIYDTYFFVLSDSEVIGDLACGCLTLCGRGFGRPRHSGLGTPGLRSLILGKCLFRKQNVLILLSPTLKLNMSPPPCSAVSCCSCSPARRLSSLPCPSPEWSRAPW